MQQPQASACIHTLLHNTLETSRPTAQCHTPYTDELPLKLAQAPKHICTSGSTVPNPTKQQLGQYPAQLHWRVAFCHSPPAYHQQLTLMPTFALALSVTTTKTLLPLLFTLGFLSLERRHDPTAHRIQVRRHARRRRRIQPDLIAFL